ncbi:anhydro-N-acetylmuramic acid kinase [Carboxylicivirga taeanensis]|uniref:anhydro-N-acetylmuramic acid kinase n=1 Tax=Carboxylicivirga taeanensis TaxID=1416875 RepID=UPI003F6E1BCC
MVKQLKNSYCCVGLMSGTSLDGLDIVLCEFTWSQEQWHYTLLKHTTIAYPNTWQKRLKEAPALPGKELLMLHREYGQWLGTAVSGFLKGLKWQPDFIASHGHTVYHEPEKGFNFQLGDGNMISACTHLPVIADFRSLDVCFGGQGAPLVPIGDELLFGNYSACVNIGGFVNVSCPQSQRRIAWDICPANFVVNRLVKSIGMAMDRDGLMGQQGDLIESLQDDLSSLHYYKQSAPKSLSQEWVDEFIWPIFNNYQSYSLNDRLRTFYEHISDVIAHELSTYVSSGRILFTGGGVYNTYLMKLISEKTKSSVIVPDEVLIEYKEALVFAFLGLLRYRGEVNCLKSVTGAVCDSSSGVVYG